MNLPNWLLYAMVTILVSTPFYMKMRDGGGAQSERFNRSFRTLVLIPGIVAFGFRLAQNTGFSDINLGFGRWPWLLPVAILFPILMEFLLIFTSIRFSLAQHNSGFVKFQDGQAHPSESVQLLLGHQPQSTPRLLLNLGTTVLVGTLFALIFSLVEEFGWRGFLQTEVINALGVNWGLIMGGLAWGGWHVPLVLMGYKFPDYPRLGAYVYMPIATISIGIVIGFFYWLSGSLWAPTLLNASTQVSDNISIIWLGDAARTRRIRIVWLWLWAVVAGLCLALWSSGVAG